VPRGLEDVYQLRFEAFRPLDSSGPLTLAALLGRRVDVALLFTTDGDLASDELVLLEDDKRLQPAENVVPVVRRSILDRHGPAVRTALAAVTAALDTEDLVDLNRQVDGGEPRRRWPHGGSTSRGSPDRERCGRTCM
jgi:osmoprotectant transport system substrate-binding protein